MFSLSKLKGRSNMTFMLISFIPAIVIWLAVAIMLFFIFKKKTPKEDPFWENYSWNFITSELEKHTNKFYAWSKFLEGLPEGANQKLIYAAIYEMDHQSWEVEKLNEIAYKKFLHS